MAARRPSPNTWLWRIAAITGLAWAVIAVVVAAIGPSEYVPRVFSSYHVEHFIAFYMIALLAATGLARARLDRIALMLSLLAILLALVRLTLPGHRVSALEDMAADLGGVAAAIVPILVGRFRELAGNVAVKPE